MSRAGAVLRRRVLPLVWCAVAVGLAFNVKMLQAYFVLPVAAVVFLVAGKASWRRKLLGLGAATAVLLVVSGAWMVLVDAVPVASRPFVGGSTDGTVRDLLFGYNGFGRVDGQARIMSPGMMGGGHMPPGGAGHVPPGGPGSP